MLSWAEEAVVPMKRGGDARPLTSDSLYQLRGSGRPSLWPPILTVVDGLLLVPQLVAYDDWPPPQSFEIRALPIQEMRLRRPVCENRMAACSADDSTDWTTRVDPLLPTRPRTVHCCCCLAHSSGATWKDS